MTLLQATCRFQVGSRNMNEEVASIAACEPVPFPDRTTQSLNGIEVLAAHLRKVQQTSMHKGTNILEFLNSLAVRAIDVGPDSANG